MSVSMLSHSLLGAVQDVLDESTDVPGTTLDSGCAETTVNARYLATVSQRRYRRSLPSLLSHAMSRCY